MKSMLKFFCVDLNRTAEHDTKLMGIYSNTLGIPETEYGPYATMGPANLLISYMISHN